MSPVTLDLSTARDVWIIKPSSLGDVIHTVPVVAALSRRWPHLAIRWVINAEWAPIIEGSPFLAEALHFQRRTYRGLSGGIRFIRWVRSLPAISQSQSRPDVVLDFQGLLRSALIGRGSKTPRLVGLSDAREGAAFLYHQTLDVDPQAHAIDRYLTMARAAGIELSQDDILNPADWPEGDVVPQIVDQVAVGSPILLHPFSRGQGKSLTWEDVQWLVRQWPGHPVLVVGSAPAGPVPTLPPCVTNLCGQTTLRQLIWLLRKARVTVSVDSGPMHLAAALRRPLIGIHTWSDPRKVGPYSPEAWVWKGGRLVRRSEVDEALASQELLPSPQHLSEIAKLALQLSGGGEPHAAVTAS